MQLLYKLQIIEHTLVNKQVGNYPKTEQTTFLKK